MRLHTYGIQITLERGMRDLDAALTPTNMSVGYYSKHRGMIMLPTGRYTVGSFLGAGSFGNIYQVWSEKGETSTVKLIAMQNVSFASVMRECIVHILLEQESTGEPMGPFVPRFYEAAYDPYNDIMILRTETVDDILYDRYKAATMAENDTIVPNTIAQLAHMLDFFYKRLQFNHRDCKPNNMLYNYNRNTGRLEVKIIDFGYACLTWQGVRIYAGDRFATAGTGICYHPSRDLTQYVYATYTDRAIRMSDRLRAELREVLTFPVEGRECRMWNRCKGYGKPMEIWAHTYRFLDDRRIHNIHAEPVVLRDRMMHFLGLSENRAKTPLEILELRGKEDLRGMPHCTPDRVLSPKTRRCVRRDSPQGRQVMRLSKRYSTPSPKTLRRYRNSVVAPEAGLK